MKVTTISRIVTWSTLLKPTVCCVGAGSALAMLSNGPSALVWSLTTATVCLSIAVAIHAALVETVLKAKAAMDEVFEMLDSGPEAMAECHKLWKKARNHE